MNSVDNNTKTDNRILYTITFVIFLSVFFQKYYIDIGFAIKPFLILSIIYFILLLKRISITYLHNHEVLLIIFLIYYSSTGLFAEFPYYSLRLILGILIVLFFYFIIRFLFSSIQLKYIERIIELSGIIFNVISLLLFIIGAIKLNFSFFGNNITSYGLLIDRGTPRLIGTIIDPNIFVLFNSLFFFYYLNRMKKFGLFLSSLTLILSFSRGGIIAILFAFVIGIFISKGKVLLRNILLITVLGVIIFITLNSLFNIDLINVLSERFTAMSFDQGSGRLNIWSNGLFLFSENPIFGIGIYNFQQYNMMFFNDYHYLHNTYLEVLVESGVIGFTLYFLVFIILLYKLYKLQKVMPESRFLFTTLLSIIVIMSTLSLIINEFIFLFLALCIRYLNELKKGESNV